MTIYENITKLRDVNLLNVSITNGIIPQIYLGYLEIYENYKILRKKGLNKMQCYCNLSEDYYLSETTIRKIIKLMQP